MGIEQLLIETEKKRSEKRGIEKGAEQKSYEFVKNLIQNTDFNDDKVASLAVVAKSFVTKVRTDLDKKK